MPCFAEGAISWCVLAAPLPDEAKVVFDKEVDRCNIHELPSGELLCCCHAIHERYSRAASHACLDGRDALELDDSRKVRHGEIARRQVFF